MILPPLVFPDVTFVNNDSSVVSYDHNKFIIQREIEKERERVRNKERERGRERYRYRIWLLYFYFLKGMKGALAPFSYLVHIIFIYNL